MGWLGGFVGDGGCRGDGAVDKRSRRAPQVDGLARAAWSWFTAALGVTVAASTPMLAAMALLLALVVLSQHHRSNGGSNGSAPHG